jgi:hypothetical protein
MLDGAEFGKEIVDLVRGYVERQIGPLKAENAELKERLVLLEGQPAPVKGDAGERGADGISPEPEAVAAALLPVAEELIADAVAKAVAALPPPEKGEKGDAGERGAEGQKGADGRGVKELLIDRDGQLIATMDDGEMKSLGPIIGKDGRDGIDGKDGEQGEPGFSLDDFDIERGDDGRTFTLKFERGDTRHSYEMTFPAPVYCGVFKEGEEYAPGDLVTWGGSLWHCNRVDPGKPETKDSGWQLAVKKGRDGRDAKVG